MHTPDSSRYWIAHSYEECFRKGLEPENVDKVCHLVLACAGSIFQYFFVHEPLFLLCTNYFCNFLWCIIIKVSYFLVLWSADGMYLSPDVKMTQMFFQEFLRLWFKDHCNPYEDKAKPIQMFL